MKVLPLNERHDRKNFDCGNDALNVWLSQTARQHKDKGISSTFVAVATETSSAILGYDSVSLAELVNVSLPPQYAKRMPSRVPVFRLGRLATAIHQQGKRIGEFMLFDAIDRANRIADEIGGIGLVVNAKPSAVEFYERYGFDVMADHPQNLILVF